MRAGIRFRRVVKRICFYDRLTGSGWSMTTIMQKKYILKTGNNIKSILDVFIFIPIQDSVRGHYFAINETSQSTHNRQLHFVFR